MPGYGIQTAVSTLAGNAVGKKDELELESVVRSGLIVAVSIMTAMAIGLFFLRSRSDYMFFTKDEQVIVLGVSLLRIVAISEPMYAALIIYEGIFHGIGDTKMPFIFAIFNNVGDKDRPDMDYIGMLGVIKNGVVFMIMDNISRCILLWGLYRRRKKKLAIIG